MTDNEVKFNVLCQMVVSAMAKKKAKKEKLILKSGYNNLHDRRRSF